MKICDIIFSQLGRQTLALLGAHNLVDLKDGLQFHIQGSENVHMLQIILKPCDTYTLNFWFLKKRSWQLSKDDKLDLYDWKLVKSIDQIYFDMLHDAIEEVTGLYTTLHPRA